ncbi:hypothetical protein EX895_005780 [Sporisorium graminicola]|uniref:Uncharacterized protein n=1 Tax=Sporisorium graminicola TaxID=280036 RepID=A0A4U7KR05_9BASI|nr:hypothetical protein EX895_005780 [Sporisorium graminicola]TKY85618.1 hypothetical protein EX895_005780 [Sporisorium graminicola]
MAIKPSHREEEHAKQTAEALDFCASLLQTRGPPRVETKESQLKRFVLMLVRYTRVLLHYPFCRVDKDHRKAVQESVSAIISTVLGTLLSFGAEDEDEDEDEGEDEDEDEEYDQVEKGDYDGERTVHCNGEFRGSGGLAQPNLARFARVDRHLLELLAGLSVRALVFTLALMKHPIIHAASEPGPNDDDSERQRSDAVLALGALEQLHQLGLVSLDLLRRARKVARLGGET